MSGVWLASLFGIISVERDWRVIFGLLLVARKFRYLHNYFHPFTRMIPIIPPGLIKEPKWKLFRTKNRENKLRILSYILISLTTESATISLIVYFCLYLVTQFLLLYKKNSCHLFGHYICMKWVTQQNECSLIYSLWQKNMWKNIRSICFPSRSPWIDKFVLTNSLAQFQTVYISVFWFSLLSI